MTQHRSGKRYLRCGEFSGVPEAVSCPVCVHPPAPSWVFRMSNGVVIWLCPGCNAMYASPRFNGVSLSAIYENPALADVTFLDDWSYGSWTRENKHKS